MISYFIAECFLKLLIIFFVGESFLRLVLYYFPAFPLNRPGRKKMLDGGGIVSLAGKSFDSIHWFHSESCFKASLVIKYTYVAYLKVLLWFVFSIDGLFILMVNWNEAYSEPCKTSEVELLAELVNDWKPLTFFSKKSVLDFWKAVSDASSAWKVNCTFCYILQFEITCIVCHFSTTRLPLEMLHVLGFLRSSCPGLIYNFCGNDYFENLATVSIRNQVFLWNKLF